ncbi:beta-taxilin isoform X2 [Platichthys flesus]|uniref:beta-taxilin isoform X2 n=1 Tax=Platichthys flesus TaxID=8260 RepID=UPI002DB5A85D|nr:beta-taxilin isoform X2 [Platichthys flesus]XP_062266964.1 beta-taxilin isoform X2 [Platichthys flesus]
METVKVVLTAQPDAASSSRDEDTSGSDLCDPMQEFSRRLEAIISSYGAAASSLPDKQSSTDTETEKTKGGAKEDVTATMETDMSLIMQSLNKSSSSEEKLGDLVRKYAELATLRRCDERKLCVLQQKMCLLQEERRSSVAARSKLETLCRDLQSHYTTLREETLQRCREDEEKRSEITCHFQKMLKEIQTQIEQHSSRNDKLCQENANLTDKLESLMNQCDRREESLEKIERHRDLQHKLTEAKLQEANMLLTQAEEKHKREKEYLLREAIDKTKKCFGMKEQELAMKKKLTLYGEKFDEFQTTLSKSNEIYVRFKREMENMSEKMKTMEKESNVWKSRFENCNKALTDMMQERTDKAREYDQFVVTIHKLERLCRALQEERTILYDKIKGIRQSNSQLPEKLFSSSLLSEAEDKAVLLTPVELQEDDPMLTEDMARLRQEQAKLQEFADSLFATPADLDRDAVDVDLGEDEVAAAFANFKTKPQVQQEPASGAEQEVEADVSLQDKVEMVEKPDVSPAGAVEVKPEEEQLSAQEPAAAEKVEHPPATEPEAETLKTPAEVKADEPVQATPTDSKTTSSASNAASSKKQAPKKKKKRSGKSSS